MRDIRIVRVGEAKHRTYVLYDGGQPLNVRTDKLREARRLQRWYQSGIPQAEARSREQGEQG